MACLTAVRVSPDCGPGEMLAEAYGSLLCKQKGVVWCGALAVWRTANRPHHIASIHSGDVLSYLHACHLRMSNNSTVGTVPFMPLGKFWSMLNGMDLTVRRFYFCQHNAEVAVALPSKHMCGSYSLHISALVTLWPAKGTCNSCNRRTEDERPAISKGAPS